MTWCNESSDVQTVETIIPSPTVAESPEASFQVSCHKTCPSCGHKFKFHEQAGIHDLPGLPAGVKFDPTDQEVLGHLEGKVRDDARKLHPLIDEFIRTIDGENGICYTHPEKLPGVSTDGTVRHFFHRPSKAYTTGTRKRRKVHTDSEVGGETRWHKTGKTRPVLTGGRVKGYKKILVLYTNYGKQKKPEKTNWVMHQYHLGTTEEEKEGELVVSKIFYQTQPRQCGGSLAAAATAKERPYLHGHHLGGGGSHHLYHNNGNVKGNGGGGSARASEYYNNIPTIISFNQSGIQNHLVLGTQPLP